MAASTSTEKVGPIDAPVTKRPVLPSFFSPVANVYDRFSRWRSTLGLPYPGNVESLQREVKNVHLTNFMFDGARADLTKSLSMTPAFQVTHSFSLASQSMPPSYNFGAAFANQKVYMQGLVDNEGTVNGRLNAGWNEKNVTKANIQITKQPGASVFQLEHDYQGSDYSVNAKALNPSPVDGSGIYIGSYLQSITPNLAFGTELLVQRGGPMEMPTAPTYVAKYTSKDKSWIATAQAQSLGALQATYWQKLHEKVEAAADLQVVVAAGKREGIATLGAKYDLRMSTFRAQVDSTGKVAALLEQRFAPTFAFMVAGEIDHVKNAAKVGVGVMIESASGMGPEEMGMPPHPDYPSPPSFP